MLVHGPQLAGVLRLSSRQALPAVAGAGFMLLLAQATSACAWRSGLAARGLLVPLRRSVGCYAAGSLANTALPGNAGDALRIGLFSRAAGEGSRWTSGGVCLAVSFGRAIVFLLVLALGAATGFVPWLLIVVPLAAVLAISIPSVVLGRRRSGRVRDLGRGASAVTPGLLGWVLAAMVLRLGAAALLLQSLGTGSVLAGAVLTIVAIGVSGAIPITPGNIGTASVAVAVSLTHLGIDSSVAAAVGIAFHGPRRQPEWDSESSAARSPVAAVARPLD